MIFESIVSLLPLYLLDYDRERSHHLESTCKIHEVAPTEHKRNRHGDYLAIRTRQPQDQHHKDHTGEGNSENSTQNIITNKHITKNTTQSSTTYQPGCLNQYGVLASKGSIRIDNSSSQEGTQKRTVSVSVYFLLTVDKIL